MAGVTATISVAEFRAQWMQHVPMRALCERYTITRDQVIRLAVVWDLPRRHDRRLRHKAAPGRDPTTTEIQQACLRIQATWNEQTREQRRVIKTHSVEVREVETPGGLDVARHWWEATE
jgi:hypothetical protein